jgi:hypothetical protein
MKEANGGSKIDSGLGGPNPHTFGTSSRAAPLSPAAATAVSSASRTAPSVPTPVSTATSTKMQKGGGVPVTPTSMLRTQSASALTSDRDNSTGGESGDKSRRGSANIPPFAPSNVNKTNAINNASPASTASSDANRARLSSSLTKHVYAHNKDVSSTPEFGEGGQMNAGVGGVSDAFRQLTFSEEMEIFENDGRLPNVSDGTTTEAEQPAHEDVLVDLFNPLKLASIRSHKGEVRRTRDLVKGSSVRDYFSLFTQTDLHVPTADDQTLEMELEFKQGNRIGTSSQAAGATVIGGGTGTSRNVASGVGMPQADKAYLATYTSTVAARNIAEGFAGNVGSSVVATPVAATASYLTPTVSYSWRLAARRQSATDIVNAAAATSSGQSPARSDSSARAISPQPNSSGFGRGKMGNLSPSKPSTNSPMRSDQRAGVSSNGQNVSSLATATPSAAVPDATVGGVAAAPIANASSVTPLAASNGEPGGLSRSSSPGKQSLFASQRSPMNADPSDSLGLDLAIEKLQAGLVMRSPSSNPISRSKPIQK